MKSWIHEISESYVEKRRPVRKDLLEHYRTLNEHQKFDLIKYNMMVYLDEQVKTAYGINLEDLNEEQLNELVGGLMGAIGGIGGVLTRGAQKVRDVTVAGAKKVASAVAKPIKAGLDYAGAGEEARGEVAAERGREIQAAETVGGKLRAATQRGKGMMAALRAGYKKGLGDNVKTDSPKETPSATAKISTGDEEPISMGTETATGTTRRGSRVEMGASGASVSLHPLTPKKIDSTPETETLTGPKPISQKLQNRLNQYRARLEGEPAPEKPSVPGASILDRAAARVQRRIERKTTPESEPTTQYFNLGVEMPRAQLPPGSVTLGPEGETVNTGGRFVSNIATPPVQFTRRRRNSAETETPIGSVSLAGKKNTTKP